MSPILINEERKVEKNSVLDFVYSRFMSIYKKNLEIFFNIHIIFIYFESCVDEFSFRSIFLI